MQTVEIPDGRRHEMDPVVEYRDELLRLDRAMVGRDGSTAAHSVRVGLGVRVVGRALGLPAAELETLGWAGRLHDVGKLEVPLGILNNSGPLDADEWDIVRRHPSAGADMILGVTPRLAAVAAGVRSHHERWDGAGYPLGLAGQEIPLHGRIIALVDVFDAVTHPRCYRDGVMSAEEALLLVLDGSGRQFDPTIVPAFVIAVLQGWPVSGPIPDRTSPARAARASNAAWARTAAKVQSPA